MHINQENPSLREAWNAGQVVGAKPRPETQAHLRVARPVADFVGGVSALGVPEPVVRISKTDFTEFED